MLKIKNISVKLDVTAVVFLASVAMLRAYACLVAALMHEVGHVVAIRLCGGRVNGVSLSGLGADIRYSGVASYHGEVVCAISGGAVNLACAATMAAVGRTSSEFCAASLALAVFNLLPALPLDGGVALRAAMLACGASDGAAHNVVCFISKVTAIAVAVVAAYLLFYGISMQLAIMLCAVTVMVWQVNS